MGASAKDVAVLALHRFGLGPRLGSIAAIKADPRGALLAELDHADGFEGRRGREKPQATSTARATDDAQPQLPNTEYSAANLRCVPRNEPRSRTLVHAIQSRREDAECWSWTNWLGDWCLKRPSRTREGEIAQRQRESGDH
jgi:uncharacterized protein (DUF1800 family)